MNDKDIKKLAEHGYYRNQHIHGDIEETHISWVILHRKNAFKIKKPVKLSFLDFSTITKRKRYCIRELNLNRRFSPIYLDVLPVRKYGTLWRVGEGKGKIVDYAVHMKRLMFSKRMDKLLAVNKVQRGDIIALADVIASFHAKAEVVKQSFNLAEARREFNDISSLVRLSRTRLGEEYQAIIKRSIKWSDQFLKIHAGRLQERIKQGFVRDVHGDLHSANIFLYKKPILFDCIEFNDTYRRIDILKEIAFLCMDLEAYKHANLTPVFLKAYQRQLNCFKSQEDNEIFLYYKCLKANVRAKVHALAAQQTHDADISRHHVDALKTYLQLMNTYMA